jgi:hypothetical protein
MQTVMNGHYLKMNSVNITSNHFQNLQVLYKIRELIYTKIKAIKHILKHKTAFLVDITKD